MRYRKNSGIDWEARPKPPWRPYTPQPIEYALSSLKPGEGPELESAFRSGGISAAVLKFRERRPAMRASDAHTAVEKILAAVGLIEYWYPGQPMPSSRRLQKNPARSTFKSADRAHRAYTSGRLTKEEIRSALRALPRATKGEWLAHEAARGLHVKGHASKSPKDFRGGRLPNPAQKYITEADVPKRVKSIRSRIRALVKTAEVDGSSTNPKWNALFNSVFELERDAWASGLPSDFSYLNEEVRQGQAEGERLHSEYLRRQLKAAREEARDSRDRRFDWFRTPR